MSNIALLNRRLGSALGYVQAGKTPRFQWKQAHEIHYIYRPLGSQYYVRECWGDRVDPRVQKTYGKCWMISQWRPPEMTEDDWYRRPEMPGTETIALAANFPYPRNGTLYAHPETSLPWPMEPTEDLNQNYIWALSDQMATSFKAQMVRVQAELAADEAKKKEEWEDYAMSFAPAFGNYDPGTRGGFLSIGGGQRDTQKEGI